MTAHYVLRLQGTMSALKFELETMPTKKRKSKKKLSGKGRTNDAARWLESKEGPNCKYIEHYSKRYGVDSEVAREELFELGFSEAVFIEELENDGKDYEYIVNPLSGELVLVEAGTEEHELFI